MALTDKLTAIADAIRSKGGTTEQLTLDGMVEAINAISAGGGGGPFNDVTLLATIEASDDVSAIQIDWQTVVQFSELVKDLPEKEPIFVQEETVYNSTVNDILARHCRQAGVPVISVHGLRHTHASLLLFAGVSIASVARRLGHASMTTTQKTYLHVIHELENQDIDLVMRAMSSLN